MIVMNTTLYACYRRPDPVTGEIHRKAPEPGDTSSTIGLIEHTRDPALFFHAEKYRGISEDVRQAIMAADSLSAAQPILSAHPLQGPQRDRWAGVRDRVLHCACWFASTQHTDCAADLSPERFDGLDAQAAAHHVRQRLTRPTRLVIAGSRTMTHRRAGYALIDWFVSNFEFASLGRDVDGAIDEVISGNANGGDSIGEEWAMRHYIPVAHFPADWARFGKRAGYKRNQAMAERGTHLLAFHLDGSKGTGHMLDTMLRAKKNRYCFENADVEKMKTLLLSRGLKSTAPESHG